MRIDHGYDAVRVVERGIVLSETRHTPGPTDSLHDVLAACVAALAPGPRLAILGFAAGGLVAPLRAMGWNGEIAGVDHDERGEAIFRRVSTYPTDDVRVHFDDASRWLEAQEASWDFVLEDLSVPCDERGVRKPAASWDEIPALVARRLAPGGRAAFNLVEPPKGSWRRALRAVAAPFRSAAIVEFERWENRIVIAGDARAERERGPEGSAGSALTSPRDLARALARPLARIRSSEERVFAVRSLAGCSADSSSSR